ncbi:EAL domain-containing protein [Hydrogenimonas urashimensis]|uniref:EAL domain-containing protein n=1 Tax=Hydrogenimonas urashimensis TaxID=2740515 RepID=UPI001915398D|nr:bifunctional diguanylate cyclase/phosphodiesterase [Hydrogenimonas urashimensis]
MTRNRTIYSLLPLALILLIGYDLYMTHQIFSAHNNKMWQELLSGFGRMDTETIFSRLRAAWSELETGGRFALIATYLFSFLFFMALAVLFFRQLSVTGHLGRLKEELDKRKNEVAKLQKELSMHIYTDPLTGIPNGNALKKRVERPDHDIEFLVHTDIDAFHEINELYGDNTGDELLQQLADLLKTHFNKPHFDLYRLRSDEFVIASTKGLNRIELDHELSLLVSVVNNHRFVAGSDSFHIAVRAGASMERDNLLATVGMALKCAKKSYRNYCIYAPQHDLTEQYRSNLSWIRQIKRALEEDRVILHYQPIVRVSDNSINAYECLVRIVDNDGTIHYPVEFLELAKRSKIYFDITMRVLDQAFASFHDHPGHFSINLSYDDIANGNIMGFIIEKVRRFPEPHRIHFEILECDKIKNYETVRRFTDKVRRMGCSISLDDFGSGYSNFEHILKLDLDMLKIDGSLIKNILTDQNSRLIVETIIRFAQKLDLDTCVEFVSDKATYDLLKSMEVTYMQGFYLSKPKPYH